MHKHFKLIGILIALSSLITIAEHQSFILTPIVVSLGCIVYGMGVMIEILNNKDKN